MLTALAGILSRTRTVILLFVLLMISGILSFSSIPRELFPDVTIPMAYVSISQEGISPEDADAMLVSPLEKELKSLEGLDELTSTASEGHASVMLQFDTNVDIDEALADTREAVDRAKGQLPQDADDPTVNEINIALFPILGIALAGDVDERVLKYVAEDLQERLEALPGVLTADINGVRQEVAEVVIDPQLMSSYNLSHNEVISLVSSNNQLVTAGNLDTGAGRFAVKVPGLIESEEDILNLPIKTVGSTVVRFRDIAYGQRAFIDRESISRVNGKPAVTLEISKRVGQNIIETVDAVKAVVEEVEPAWPDGIQVSYFQDQSVQTKTQLTDLNNNVIFATLLVIVVILATLGVRSSILVGLAIPSSFLTGILLIHIMGYTLNMVVLFALIMTVGMLVDGAIVVTEYADRRMNEGTNRKQAYREASLRMAWPITSSTLTTLMVFMPLLFWPGIMGEFMKFLPITVLVTLSASLVMAMVAIPALGMLFGKPSAMAAFYKNSDNKNMATQSYLKILAVALKYPITTFFMIVCLMVSIFGLYAYHNNGVEFFPSSDADSGSIAVRARGNLSLQEKDALVRQVEAHVLGMPEIKSIFTKVTASQMRDYAEDAIGVIQLEFVDWQSRRKSRAILEEIIAKTASIPGIRVEKQEAQKGPTAGVDIQMEFISSDLKQLQNTVALISDRMSQNKKLVDVSDNLPLDGIEWQIDVDREAAARFGADIRTVGSSIRMITNGLKVGSYRPDDVDDELDIRLRYPYNERNLDQINAITIAVQGQQVPISNFITRSARNRSGEIYRTDGKLTLKIEANVAEGFRKDLVITELGNQIKQAYQEGDIPPVVIFRFAGDQQDQAETMGFLGKAFGVAFFLMIIILVTQFNSFFQAALILSAVFFSTAGVFLGLLITGDQFGIVMCGVGLISLAGIVVNNNIVMIDTYNIIRQKRSGLSAFDAVMLTCAERFRPIMLTTITTILGLMPMVYQWNIDLLAREFTVGAPSSQMWTQLATSIAGGLTYTTILTLFLTPALLVLKDRKKDSTAQSPVDLQTA